MSGYPAYASRLNRTMASTTATLTALIAASAFLPVAPPTTLKKVGDRTISSVCFSVYPWNTLAPSSVITTGCTRLHIFAAWRARMGTLTGTRRMRFSFSFSFSPPAALRVPHREDPGKAFMNQSATESTATCVAMDTQGWRMCRGFARNVSKAMYAWTCFRTMAYSRNRMAANHARYPKTLLGEGGMRSGSSSAAGSQSVLFARFEPETKAARRARTEAMSREIVARPREIPINNLDRVGSGANAQLEQAGTRAMRSRTVRKAPRTGAAGDRYRPALAVLPRVAPTGDAYRTSRTPSSSRKVKKVPGS